MTQIDNTQNLSIPKFQLGTHVKCNARSGCRLRGEVAQVIAIKYITSEYWSGWTYTIENLYLTMNVGEIWLDAAPTV
ncbi:hypothetical protein [Aliterella atlantica]|uniref:Uncharacterized protein n=1 Tax=Aliterella atlantica CENA595 TaxID=1618023 RepID=A0A0D8ZLU3_9CYAN|nr:hypothetical protein [Aliterella atlantica]KJH69788.1 hypothetical protein UH38_22015 [Aliterella atlantica CENA595]